MFGQLPSHVITNGTTFDILVANTLAEYENNLMNPETAVPKLTEQEMMAMLKAAREE